VIKITEEKYRRPLLTSRQVAMIAAFGGLGFAWRALGLIIPLYPPYVLDIRESINVIAAFAGGPWVAIGVGILIGLPSSVPFCDVIYYPLIGIILSLVSKHIFEKRDVLYGAYSLVIIAIVLAIAEAIALTIFNFELAIVGLVSFEAEMIASFLGGTYLIYVIQEIIPLWIILKLFPDFMRPIWRWTGGEEE
jgi:hypothetical protein